MTAAAIVESKFEGWEKPESNFFKVPNEFWEITDLSPHERMVLLYILRHTWGFQEFGVMKHIMIDEFQHGRISADGSRMDKGCGVSRGKVSEALKSLEEKGYIQVVTDVTDPARVKKFVMLNMLNNTKDSVQQMNPAFSTRTQRSRGDTRTEKETIERKETTPISPTVDTELEEMESAVKKHCRQYDSDQVAAIAKSLLCRFTGIKAKKNVSRKMTPADLEAWANHWDKSHIDRKTNEPLTRPRNQSSVLNWVNIWLEEQIKPVIVPKAPAAAPVVSVLSTVTDADRAEALEVIRAARESERAS